MPYKALPFIVGTFPAKRQASLLLIKEDLYENLPPGVTEKDKLKGTAHRDIVIGEYPNRIFEIRAITPKTVQVH